MGQVMQCNLVIPLNASYIKTYNTTHVNNITITFMNQMLQELNYRTTGKANKTQNTCYTAYVART